MRGKRNKILIMTSEFPPLPGGIGNQALNLAVQLSKNQFEVEIIADQRTNTNEENLFDNSLPLKVNRVPLRSMRWTMYLNRIRFLWNRSRSSEIVLASGKFPLWAVAVLSLIRKRFYVAVIHGSEVNFSNQLLNWAVNRSLKRFDEIIAVSRFTAGLVSHLGLESLHVIPNGHDMNPDGMPLSPMDLKGTPKLITVGNVTSRKGQINLIRHLPELVKRYPELHYHCVGFPTQAPEFMEVARHLEVDQHLSFHGRVEHDQLESYLVASDIAVMLSSPTNTGDVEGFGIALIEANAYGLPAIGSSGCGIEDAIKNGETGYLVEYSNPSEFAMALQAILSNYKVFSDMAIAWAGKHKWEEIIKQYIVVLNKT